MSVSLEQHIRSFLSLIASGSVEVYNEFSLQHELGVFLRGIFQGKKVQFERNVDYFFSSSDFVKREIDLSVFSESPKNLDLAIELKFPRNGQYPEQMYSFCKDICFIEQLKQAGFQSTYLLILADQRPFYSGSSEGIYGFFRSGKLLNGLIKKPTGKSDSEVFIKGSYQVNWHLITEDLRYALIEGY